MSWIIQCLARQGWGVVFFVPGVPLAVNVVRDCDRLWRRFLRCCRRCHRCLRWFPRRRLRCPIRTLTNYFRALSKAAKRRVDDTANSTAEFLAGSRTFVGHRIHRIVQVCTRLRSSQCAWPAADISAFDSIGATSISTRRLNKSLRIEGRTK